MFSLHVRYHRIQNIFFPSETNQSNTEYKNRGKAETLYTSHSLFILKQ
jgi:hypothetical protein